MQLVKQIIYLFLVIQMVVMPLNVFAYFSDQEITKQNIIQLGTLDFSLFSPQNNFVPKARAENMDRGDMVNRMIQARQEGSIGFDYTVRILIVDGDIDFCQALNLEAKTQGVNYDGSLMDFLAQRSMNQNIHTWHFKIWLPENISNELAGKFCEFKFIFDAQQNGGVGFSDREEIKSILISASEFYEEPPYIPSNVIRIRTSLDRSN